MGVQLLSRLTIYTRHVPSPLDCNANFSTRPTSLINCQTCGSMIALDSELASMHYEGKHTPKAAGRFDQGRIAC